MCSSDLIAGREGKADIKDCVTKGAAIPDFLLQYEESDWDFLIRMASHFQSFLVPDYTADYGRAYFGIPNYEEEFILREEEYSTIKDMDRYYQVNLSGELLSQEIMKWKVKTRYSFVLAQSVKFLGIKTIVTKIEYRMVNGELCRFYELSRKKGVLSIPLKNEHINGMSIAATVKERLGNCIRVHFHIDKEYDTSTNIKFFTYAIESSFIYCMPEVGSQVHVYFPSANESDAIAVHALRMSSTGDWKSEGLGGGGYATKPECKSFSDVTGAELLMTPSLLSIAPEKDKSTKIELDTDGNAYIKGLDVTLNADKNLFIGEPYGEGGSAALEIEIKAASISIVVGDTKLSLTEETKIVAAFIRLDASDKTPASDPSSEEVMQVVVANKAQILENANAEVTYQLINKYEEGKTKILEGAVKIITTVVTVAVVVTVTVVATAGAAAGVVVTGGVGAALIAPAMLGVYALAGTTILYCVADISEGSNDVTKSLSGDLSESYNFIRDSCLLGDETAYKFVKLLNDVAFGIVSGKAIGSAFGIMEKSGKFLRFACNSSQLKTVKAAVQIGSNVFAGGLRDVVYTGKINLGNLFFNTGVGMAQGYAGTGATNWLVSKLGINGLGNTVSYAAKVGIGTVVDTSIDGASSSLLGKEFDLWQSLALNAFANSLTTEISDPVDAVTGAYVIRATDVLLASMPSAFKVERRYLSNNKKSSVMGRGWTFPYASRIYCDINNEKRVHLETITGHMVLFEKNDDKWINKTKGTSRFILKSDQIKNLYQLYDVIEHSIAVYNEKGQLVQIEYPNSQKIKFEYGEDGLKKIVTPLNNVLDIVSKNDKIVQITDEIRRKTQYKYKGNYLTDVIYADEGITHYEYDSSGFIISETDQNGVRYLENSYDKRGRIISQVFENGACQRFSYDDKNKKNTVTFSESGKTEIYEYNDRLLTKRIIYEDRTFISYEYSEQNLRTRERSRTGIETNWDYDIYGRLVCERKSDGYEKRYEYDQKNDLIRVYDTNQRESRYEYDQNHNNKVKQERISTNEWKETKYDYDVKGRCIVKKNGLGNKTRYQYAVNKAYPSCVINPKKEETIYEYDKVGRRMSIRNAYGTVELSYNSRNFVTERKDGEGYDSHWIYDKMGNLNTYYPAKQWKNKEGGYEYKYDFLERLIDTIPPPKRT